MDHRPGRSSIRGERIAATGLACQRYIDDGETVIASPHKVYGPQNKDTGLQLRKRGIDKVILAGMSANLRVEAYMRKLLEQGFEVAVVKDATAAAKALRISLRRFK